MTTGSSGRLASATLRTVSLVWFELVATPDRHRLLPRGNGEKARLQTRRTFGSTESEQLPRLSRASCLVLLGMLSAALLQCLRVPTVFAVSAAPRAAHVLAGAEPGALVSLPGLRIEDAPPREPAPTKSERRQEQAEPGASNADGRGMPESLPRRLAETLGRGAESVAESRLSSAGSAELMIRRCASRAQMLQVSSQILEVGVSHQLLEPRLDDVSRLRVSRA